MVHPRFVFGSSLVIGKEAKGKVQGDGILIKVLFVRKRRWGHFVRWCRQKRGGGSRTAVIGALIEREMHNRQEYPTKSRDKRRIFTRRKNAEQWQTMVAILRTHNHYRLLVFISTK